MTLWAIRHKPTGRIMPAVKGRGATGLNFHIDGFEKDFPRHKLRKEPRLFIDKLSAGRALRAWLQGEWTRHITGGASQYGDDYDEYSAPPLQPPADRKAEDFELICYRLVLVPKTD